MTYRHAFARLALALVLTGCAGGIEEIGPNKYRIQMASEATDADADRAEDEARRDAADFCASQRKQVTQQYLEQDSFKVRSGDNSTASIKSTLTFRCK